MGPIEKELRSADLSRPLWPCRMTNESLRFAIGTASSMGCEEEFLFTIGEVDADVLSEAIEAAQALGL